MQSGDESRMRAKQSNTSPASGKRRLGAVLLLVLCCLVLIACAFLLSALVSWVIRDSKDSFASLWKIFQDALIVPR